VLYAANTSKDMTLPCYISKQNLADICCKTPRKVKGNFCVNTEIFQPTNMIENIYFDLSNTNNELKNKLNE
jgi:hypothetical protein